MSLASTLQRQDHRARQPVVLSPCEGGYAYRSPRESRVGVGHGAEGNAREAVVNVGGGGPDPQRAWGCVLKTPSFIGFNFFEICSTGNALPSRSRFKNSEIWLRLGP